MLLIGQARAIRTLCTLAEAQSFSAAGRSMGLSQSAVSQQVATLEKLVGLPLVLRGTRPVQLTEAGAVLVRHGTAVLAQLEAAEQTLGEIEGRLAGRLRLGSFPTALVSFVGAALVQLRHHSPDLVLTVVDDHMERLAQRLASGELDLAVLYENPALDGNARAGEVLTGAARVTLFDDPFRLLLPAGHRLADSTRVSLTALAGERWIGGRAGSAWFRIVQQACRSAGFTPRTELATDDHRAVQAFVAAGLGIAVVPGLAAARPLPGVVVRTLTRAPVRRISAVRPAGEPVPPQVRLMTELLTQATADHRTGPAGSSTGHRPPRP